MKDLGTAAITLLIVVAIIYLSYIGSKFVGKGFALKQRSKYLNLVDQVSVGQDKSIAIVQVGIQYYLVGIASSKIEKLADIEEEDLIPLVEREKV